MEEKVVEVKSLYRSFVVNNKNVEILKDINFHINKGEVFGLLGHNGAGKTTLIKILTTMLAPTSGESKVLGYDTFKESKYVREKINFVFGGERSLYWRLSARKNLEYFADLYKIPSKYKKQVVEEAVKKVKLEKDIDKKVETFSKGMKQRLQIARALLNNPEIIFLDEPSIGLDPIGASELRQLIKELSNSGTTILLTTHYMAEAEELCDRIAILKEGKILAIDNVEGLQNLISEEKKAEIKERKEKERDEKIQKNVYVTLEDIYIELLGEK